MAAAVSLEPFRVAMTALMLTRPRPRAQLTAFLCGGFTMGLTVGAVVLFLFRSALAGSRELTMPRLQVLIGMLALMVAVVLVISARTGRAAPAPGGLASRLGRLLEGPQVWVAWVVGLGIALPSVDYLAALAIILASGSPALTQFGAVLMFNAVAFALVEIPLAGFILAPGRTRSQLAALNNWISSRSRTEVAALCAVAGCVLITAGLIGLRCGPAVR